MDVGSDSVIIFGSGAEGSAPLEQGLNLMCWNIGGLDYAKWRSICDFLSEYDVVCLLETWLKSGIDPQLELNNHLCIGVIPAGRRRPRGRYAGGLTLYVAKRMEPFVVKLDVPHLRNNMIWLSYTPAKGKKLLVGFLYNPPKDSPFAITDIYEELQMGVEYARRRVDPQNEQSYGVLILGDHNARTGRGLDGEIEVPGGAYQPSVIDDSSASFQAPARRSYDTVTNCYGRRLLQFCKNTELVIVNGRVDGDNDGFTYIGNAGRSTIDYVMISIESWSLIKSMNIHPRVESDHLPISISLVQEEGVSMESHVGIDIDNNNTHRVERFRWDGKYTHDFLAKIEYYAYFLSGLVNVIRMEPLSRLDSYVAHMQELFELAGSKMRQKPSRNEGVSYSARRIQQLKNTAKRKLRNFRRCRTNEALQVYLTAKRRWNRKRKEYITRKHEVEKILLESALESKDTRAIWCQIRKITTPLCKINSTITPGQWVQHFNQVYNVDSGQERGEWQSPNMSLTDRALDAEITQIEVATALKNLRNNKAPGWDGIPMEFYKYSAPFINRTLANLFDFLYEKACYPTVWARSVIQPIYKKKGSPNDPDNWRGVALLPTIAKVYTRILYVRLRKWVLEKGLICENQAGFRPGYSTVDDIFVLRSLIDGALVERKGRLYCCFVDFRKAFDSVCRSALWYKLGSLGVSGKFIQALRQIYSLSKFVVKSSQHYVTSAVPSITGVLQGCQLSPLLFIIFINDLIEFLEIPHRDAPCVAGQPVHALLFADDLILISRTVKGLQGMLDRLQVYCRNWNLQVNKDKTKVVVFKKGVKLAKNEKWTYEGQNLEIVKEFRYLGVLFVNNGLWKKHMKVSVNKARIGAAQVLKLSYRCPRLPQSLILRVYDATVKMALLYGAEIWGVDADDSLEAPSTFFYKRILRMPMSAANIGIHWYMDREGTNVSHRVEASLRGLCYWFKIQSMEDTRLPKKCYMSQIAGMHQNQPCWALKIKLMLESLDLHGFWTNPPRSFRVFRASCLEKMERLERDRWRNRAAEFPSLNTIRVVKELVGRGAPIVSREIGDNPEKHRWIVMTLLACPGSLVVRNEGGMVCSVCAEPVVNVFSHLLAFCRGIPQKLRESQNLAPLINCLRARPEEAVPDIIYWLFMGANRFRVQQDYAELLCRVCQ